MSPLFKNRTADKKERLLYKILRIILVASIEWNLKVAAPESGQPEHGGNSRSKPRTQTVGSTWRNADLQMIKTNYFQITTMWTYWTEKLYW